MVASRSFYTSDTYAEHYLGIRWPRAVWAAVLDRAVKDAVGDIAEAETKGLGPISADKLRDDLRFAAECWIADDANEPRRFVWVCEVLGLDPATVRRSIAERKIG